MLRDWALAQFNADAAGEPGKPQPVPGIGTAAYAAANSSGPVMLVWERGVTIVVNGVSSVSANQVSFLAKVAVGELNKPK